MVFFDFGRSRGGSFFRVRVCVTSNRGGGGSGATCDKGVPVVLFTYFS